MGVHIEWADAKDTRVDLAGPGEMEGSDRPNQFAGIVFDSGSACLLIEGKRDDLVKVLKQALALAEAAPVTAYVATISTPGFLPVSEPVYFATEREAWEYLADERRRHEDDAADEGFEGFSETVNQLEMLSRGEWEQLFSWTDGTGGVYGGTPGYDGEHDLGLAYVVAEVES